MNGSADPALIGLRGLVRSVRTPEFAGITFHEVAAKSALNRVPSGSPMPFHWTVNPYRGCSHQCVYCLHPDTLVLMADGRQRPIGRLSVGDEIVGTRVDGRYRRYVTTRVQAKWGTRKRAYRVTLADGTELIASGDHRFLSSRGWKHVTGTTSGGARRPHLTTANSLQGFGLGGSPTAEQRWTTTSFRRGYLSGMIRGDGSLFHGRYVYGTRTTEAHVFRLALADTEALDRTRDFLRSEGVETYTRPFGVASQARRAMLALHTRKRAHVAAIERLIERPETVDEDWHAGFLSGIFDAEGSHSQGCIRISNKDASILADIEGACDALDVPIVREAARDNGVSVVRVRGGLPARRRFLDITRPAITRKLGIVGEAVKTVADLRVVRIEDLGYDTEMVDITTGTGDFVANGVISHNCFARNTHTYLDLDAGKDFDDQIVVKVNVAEVLAAEVARRSWQRDLVALGTNTDPYQRAEGRYALMPGIITALAESGTPLSVLTKGTLLRRDLPLLATAAEHVPVDLSMSIAIFDDELQKAVEPGTPTAAARLATVRAATDLGFRVTVFLMPILPWLTDSVEHLDAALSGIAAAGAHRVIYGALHLRPGAREWFFAWLDREHPELVPVYRRLYGRSSYAPKEYRAWLARRVRPLLRRYGLDASEDDDSPEGRRGARQLASTAAELAPPSGVTLF
ncbi:radical SAM protein [Microbacterium sediminis]|uniref:Radical SAM protein n=1 Tax=Microbacterium sediminis TaxID=904291 RepID=A0A1B9N8C8_9MICO|nr:radical SAM protein [Microbacterium sediminis]